MNNYRFTDEAEKDLEDIIGNTQGNWGEDQVALYLNGLEKHLNILLNNPDIGIKRTSLAKGLVSFPYESHVIFYVKDANGIMIIRILQKAMDPLKYLI